MRQRQHDAAREQQRQANGDQRRDADHHPDPHPRIDKHQARRFGGEIGVVFIHLNQLAQDDGDFIGQRTHLAIENARRRLHPILRRQLHDLRLKLQILMLGDLEAVEQFALFGQHDQHVIALLRLTEHTTQLIELGNVLFKGLRITVEQQTHGQRAQAQHVLAHFTDRHHARQPVVVDLVGLRAHVRHLQ